MAVKFTEDEVKQALMAVIACHGNVTLASKSLEDCDHPLFVSSLSLRQWISGKHRQLYERLREEHGADLEQKLAREMRDVAAAATEVQLLALTKAKMRLEMGKDPDPAKTASFASRAGASAVDKLMTLTNRPEKIVEQRDVNEVLRSLAARKIIKMIPQEVPVDSTAVEIEGGEADE